MGKFSNNKSKYGSVSMFIHWLMVLMLFTLVIVGTFMVGLEREDPLKNTLYFLHKSSGALFLQLALIRIVWRFYSRPPQLPEQLATWEKVLSKLVTASLYALLILIPVSGIALSNAFGSPASFFGVFEFPLLFESDLGKVEDLKLLHMSLVYLTLFVVFLHIAGAIKHRYFDKEGADVLSRMLPSRD
ncbi:cytochrome b [Thalassotalea euphylliae]|uniref:Cytochrome b n=2 Tax=Thalassotalea euphylliae TaxID=1655234 RepID=A0A3E0TU38_9GAMM|nr:cytochrome b [Thalassotalea euphylliae]